MIKDFGLLARRQQKRMVEVVTTPSTGRELLELSEERCWQLLGEKTVGRLAVGGERPDIFPVNYRRTDSCVVIQTAEGQKLVSAIGHNVAFEVDAIDETDRTGWSIVVRGPAEEPQRIEQYLSAEDLEINPWAQGDKSRFILITPTHVTGREFPRSGR